MIRKSILAALLIPCCFVLINCRKLSGPDYIPHGQNTIRVGALLSLTGGGSSSGEASREALGIASVNIAGWFETAGINARIDIQMADTRTDTAEALRLVKEFYEDGIRLIIGPYSSAELAHCMSFINSHNMLIVSPSSVAVSLAIPDDNVFRFVTSDVIQGEALTKMMVDDKIKVIVPVVRDDVWGNDLLQSTSSHFIPAGGTIAQEVRYSPGTVDFTEVLGTLDQAVGEVLNSFSPNDVAVYMLALGEGGKILAHAGVFPNLNNVYWYGSSAFASNAAALNDTNATRFALTHGLPCPVFGLDESASHIWGPLQEMIRHEIGRLPDVYSLTAYDALWVLVKTFLTVGGTGDMARFRSAFIAESDRYFGASANTRLDANGDRAEGNYDFWSVKQDSLGVSWKVTARYNSATGALVRYKP